MCFTLVVCKLCIILKYLKKSFNKDIARTYTTKTALNMRAGASKANRVITVLPKGAKVQCYGYYTNDWYYVTYQGNTGFCMNAYLQ